MVAKTVGFSLPKGIPFDYQMAMDRLRSYSAPRNKLRQLCRSGQIIAVRKGLYIPGNTDDIVSPFVVSGLLYGPSYVSLESALEFHGMIPEQTREITCVCIGKSKIFDTPIGRFSYRPVNSRIFSYGVNLVGKEGATWFLAEPEKALCDRISLVSGLSAIRDVEAVVYEDLRMEPEAIGSLRIEVVREISSRYRKKNVRAFCRWLEKQNS